MLYQPAPPDYWDERPYPSVEMNLLSNDATIDDLLNMVRSFLCATGFPVNFDDKIELKRIGEGQ